MKPWKKKYDKLFSSPIPPDIFHWTTLLNFFDLYKDELSIKELQNLVDKCDKIRLVFNEGSRDPIHKKDVRPNIYEYLEYRITIKNKDEEFRETCCAIPA